MIMDVQFAEIIQGIGFEYLPNIEGATFTPSVSEEGILCWANDRNLPNPEPVCIKGDPGKDGKDGKNAPQESILYTAQALTEEQKAQARENIGAITAAEVKDVYNITSIDTIYSSVEELPRDVGNGTHYVVSASPTDRAIYTFNSSTGTWTKRTNLKSNSLYVVLTGKKAGLYRYTMSNDVLLRVETSAGKTPVKGVDYYTEADKAEMVNAVLTSLPTWTGGSY